MIDFFKKSMNVRILSLTAAIMLVPPIIGDISAQENANSEYIDKIQDVRDIAEDAGGIYFEGNDVPYIRGNQVALPIKDEATGKTLGYIVAEMDNLVFALEKAGYVGLASTITDSETERRNADSQSSKLTAVQSDTSSAKKEVTNMKETVSKEASIVTEEYYVQVGAWKNQNYAKKMLVKIKKYYPEVYIVVHDNLYKIRIPGIWNRKQGAILSKDIENAFNMKPLLVQKKQ